MYRLIYVNVPVYVTSTLKHRLKHMTKSTAKMLRIEYVKGLLIKHSTELKKRSHNAVELLRTLNIDKAQGIVNINILSLYHVIFKVDSPARRLIQYLLFCLLHMMQRYLVPF